MTRELVIDAVRVRWQVEEFHRSFKQMTGAEKCQCRKASAQRNHLTCAICRGYRWLSMHGAWGRQYTKLIDSNRLPTYVTYSKIQSSKPSPSKLRKP